MDMEKVGIVTLFGLSNYGNRLQNYATQEVFRTLGFDCSTIVSSEYELKYRIKFWLKTFLRKEWRHISFNRFNKKYISIYKVPHTPLLFPKEVAKRFLFFVVGSDQVWNPEIRQNQRSNFFLEFADEGQRLTIAPSVAVKEIPKQWQSCFQKGLSGFEFISVREEQSKDIIEKLANKKVEVLIDPTMAITREQWEKIERKVKRLPQKYIVKLFLGKINSTHDRMINIWAVEHKCKIIDFSEKPWHNMGPDSFLTIIHNATLVFTDSFHCSAFSIIYETPFYAGLREGNGVNDVTIRMSSRITTLLDKFGLSDKILMDDTQISIENFDFVEAKRRLKEERNKFWDFMSKQISSLRRE